MYARVTTVRTDAGSEAAARAANVASAELMPRVFEQAGCEGAILLHDPVSGTLQVIVLWDSADALVASQEFEKEARLRGGQAVGTIGDDVVQVYDVSYLRFQDGASKDRAAD